MSNISTVLEANFWKLHEAIQADGYRVTLVHFDIENEKEDYKQGLRNFIYGTKGNTPLPPDQIIPHIPALAARCSKIIYEKGKMLTCGVWLTPLSRDRHHPAIDDVNTPEKLAGLENSDLRPCAIIESSPGNRQYIFAVPRVEPIPAVFTDNIPKDQAANAVAFKLNTQYGDPGATGIQRPFRWPGFENRKPKHQRGGKFPTVKLLYANPCQCPEWQRMIAEEYAAQADMRASRIHLALGTRDNAILAYNAHRDDILNHDPDKHYSKYDIMIATRLAVTGFAEEAIADAICECTPRNKTGNREYADSTAENAFDGITEKEESKKHLWRIIESGDAYYQNDDPGIPALLKWHVRAEQLAGARGSDAVELAALAMFYCGHSRTCIERSIREHRPDLDAVGIARDVSSTQNKFWQAIIRKTLPRWEKAEEEYRKEASRPRRQAPRARPLADPA